MLFDVSTHVKSLFVNLFYFCVSASLINKFLPRHSLKNRRVILISSITDAVDKTRNFQYSWKSHRINQCRVVKYRRNILYAVIESNKSPTICISSLIFDMCFFLIVTELQQRRIRNVCISKLPINHFFMFSPDVRTQK